MMVRQVQLRKLTNPSQATAESKANEAANAATGESKKLIEEHGIMGDDRKLWGSSKHTYQNGVALHDPK